MWNLNINTNEFIYKTDRLTDIETNLRLSKGKAGRGGVNRDKLGVWD